METTANSAKSSEGGRERGRRRAGCFGSGASNSAACRPDAPNFESQSDLGPRLANVERRDSRELSPTGT